MIKNIRKRDGRIVTFEPDKITNAVLKSAIAFGLKQDKAKVLAKNISLIVLTNLKKKFVSKVPHVEDVQDEIVYILRAKGHKSIAEEYENYRQQKTKIRELEEELGIEPDSKLTVNAIEVLKSRYLQKDENGKIIETPIQMFMRVATAIASVDKNYGANIEKTAGDFYKLMSKLEFLPNSPTLFNAGAPLKQLSACFVIPIEDSLESIFTSVKQMALIEQTGGGVGFDFSRLRPKGDMVKSTKGVASGPVSFMKVFNTATEVIKAGGKRRGAMMAILRVDHPDVVEFITAKNQQGELTNFNLSVAVTDKFMDSVSKNKDYELINPRNSEPVRKIKARDVWDLIIMNAWKTGDPGVIFIDEINRHNPTPSAGKIESTNPCGEMPLLPYESCNLGSIDISKFVEDRKINWEDLERAIKLGVHFLDNVIDANRYPLSEIDSVTKTNRKIGLGIMGFAECLIKMNVPYDSDDALKIAEKLMQFISSKAREASSDLANKRGNFPNFWKSIWSKRFKSLRNATVTTIAPTGTISIIAGCSSGIEPLFAVSFMRRALEGARLFEVNSLFEKIAKERKFYSAEMLERVARTGSLQKLTGIPGDIKRIFKTSLDIKPEWHVRMQAVFQKYTDNAVSKTINLPENAKLDDVKRAYEMAYKLKCKGITVYRYGSKEEQVLYIGKSPKEEYISASAEYSGGCPGFVCPH
jgi:ribonucleoside-diphosphate reductase alpha chain